MRFHWTKKPHPTTTPKYNLKFKRLLASNIILNYIGVALTMSSLLLFMFVDSRGKTVTLSNPLQVSISRSKRGPTISERRDSSISRRDSSIHQESLLSSRQNNNEFYDPDWIDTIPLKHRRVLGIILSLISGSLYGANFLPITLSVEKNVVDNHIDATFSHFTGILISQLIYFLIYSIYRQVDRISQKIFF